jgi:tRNA(Ile)-lysidine synthase
MAKEMGLSLIAVAHRQEDSAETIIMNILRGGGIDAVTGIKPKQLQVVRPLLTVTRAEIESFCQQNDINYRTDSSNADKRYLRNKVRLELLPQLQEYNPQIVSALCRMGEMLGYDAAFLSRQADEAYSHLVREKDEGLFVPLDAIKSLDPAVSARVFLRIARNAPGKPYITHKHIEDLFTLISYGRTGATAELPGGLYANKEYGGLFFTIKKEKETPPAIPGSYTLAVPGRVVLPDNRIVRASVFRGGSPGRGGRLRAAFPLSVADGGLLVRGRQAGDTFRPLGMSGSSAKLKEFLIDCKIPREQRGNIPLVVDKEGILWVAGLRASHRDAPNTGQWLYLELLERDYIHV